MPPNCPGCRYDAEREREREERRREKRKLRREEIILKEVVDEGSEEEEEDEEDIVTMVDALMARTFAYTKAMRERMELDEDEEEEETVDMAEEDKLRNKGNNAGSSGSKTQVKIFLA